MFAAFRGVGSAPSGYAPEVFHSRVFHPYYTKYMVPRFPLLRFPPLSSGATFSTPAFSTPAFSAPPIALVYSFQVAFRFDSNLTLAYCWLYTKQSLLFFFPPFLVHFYFMATLFREGSY